MSIIAPDYLALQRLYHWEKTAPNRVALTQPMGHGAVQDLTWAQVGDQVRRMAAHLKSQGWEPGSRVALLSKNCSWWMMTDLAIWMAGYVSVPLYPTLAAETLARGTSPLTPRETQVLRAASDGGTVADIAAKLALSEGTVRNHLSAAIGKTGARTRAEAVRLADEHGWHLA